MLSVSAKFAGLVKPHEFENTISGGGSVGASIPPQSR